jgi:hypothetical protein
MIPEGTKIISHVNAPEEIRGKHVVEGKGPFKMPPL